MLPSAWATAIAIAGAGGGGADAIEKEPVRDPTFPPSSVAHTVNVYAPRAEYVRFTYHASPPAEVIVRFMSNPGPRTRARTCERAPLSWTAAEIGRASCRERV